MFLPKTALVCQKGRRRRKRGCEIKVIQYKVTNKRKASNGESQRRTIFVYFPAAVWFRANSQLHLKVSMYYFLISTESTRLENPSKRNVCSSLTNRKFKPNHKSSCHLFLKQLTGMNLQRHSLSQSCSVSMELARWGLWEIENKIRSLFLPTAIFPSGLARE